MNKHKSKASTAFSLIELSIVILIIGIIIAGITQSSRLVRQSKLKTAQQATQSSPVASIQGIAVWFEPTQDSSFPTSLDDEANITQWNDTNPQTQSRLFALPASGAAAGSSSIKYDMEGINGLPSIIFDGTTTSAGTLLVASSPAIASEVPLIGGADGAFTAFIVYKLDNAAVAANSYAVLYDGVTANNGWGYHRAGGGTNQRTVSIVGAAAGVGTTFQTSPEMATITYTGSAVAAAARSTKLFINGGTGYTTNNLAANLTTLVSTPATRMLIGGTNNIGLNAWRGYISEIIIFDSMLKTQDLKDVGNYLSKKYNIHVT